MGSYVKEGIGPGPEVMGASTLIGDKVINRQGEDLGKIEELMIDMNSGKIRYGVLSFGGFLGIGDKLFAVPFQLLELDTQRECFVFDADKEKLERAPGFNKKDWPTGHRAYEEEVNRYYGVTPYWEGYSGVERRHGIESESEHRLS